jgi:ATP adenylyltransferase
MIPLFEGRHVSRETLRPDFQEVIGVETLFAPWRMAYIATPKDHQGCIFCDFPKENNDQERLILARGEHCFVILNAFPYNPGHLMVVPYRHTCSYGSLTALEVAEMHALSSKAVAVMERMTAPQGFNMGINLGKVAGAGVDGHLHLHVVPRWNGDANFMPVLGSTRVLPEGLAETYRWMKEAWELE